MSTKRLIGITVIGFVLIAAVIGSMLLTTFLGRDDDEAILLPDTALAQERPNGTSPEQDTPGIVVVTPETIQAVVSTLGRPETYSRVITIMSFWDGGNAEYIVDVSVSSGVTSLRTTPPAGIEKRIIVTQDNLYIWHYGDDYPFVGRPGAVGDGYRTSDEWQMLVTFEDVLNLDINDIIDAGYTVYSGEDCVFVVYNSPLLGYRREYFISLEHGLVIGAREYDERGELVYSMTAGGITIGEVDPAIFTLPDGTQVQQGG